MSEGEFENLSVVDCRRMTTSELQGIDILANHTPSPPTVFELSNGSLLFAAQKDPMLGGELRQAQTDEIVGVSTTQVVDGGCSIADIGVPSEDMLSELDIPVIEGEVDAPGVIQLESGELFYATVRRIGENVEYGVLYEHRGDGETYEFV